MDKTRGIREDPQAASWSPTFVNLLVFNTCVYGACVSTIGACVCQHGCDFLRTCDLCHTYVHVHACSYVQVYFCVRIHVMFVQSTQRCCKAQETGSDGRMKNQVFSHLHVRCRLRHITHPKDCGEGSSLPELTVSFLGSSACPRGPPEDSPNGHDSSQMSRNKQGLSLFTCLPVTGGRV